ncbi:hypothetical protein FNU76_15035 [Chitinimonas arctica]|uniref:histidine kinase n=1 Tax=Chitinimonas arctica TaxID=2594795 RepID=A0A516SHF6_9NEIS|nr:histidine kinase dimerization/phospho-acceptor domain-containing protein [Chitinimonas arctica]QDQ27562.1 hypothetical protein FNU76_15035 [Chitinimonas arctica]
MENLPEVDPPPFETLQRFFEHAPLGLGVCGPDFDVLHANESLCGIAGIWEAPSDRRVFNAKVLAAFRSMPSMGSLSLNEQLDVVGDGTEPGRRWAIQLFPIDMGDKRQSCGMLWRELSAPYAVSARLSIGLAQDEMDGQADYRATTARVCKLAHDLRTPLHAMMGWLHLLESGKLPPEEYLRTIQRIKNNARTQEQLIGNLRDIVEGTAAAR